MEYVGGRKLAHSLNTLLNTDLHILDIAYNYGFEHELSYIQAFSKEFSCTPEEARKTKKILPIRGNVLIKDAFTGSRRQTQITKDTSTDRK
jgi:AraC family transcriptional regulator